MAEGTDAETLSTLYILFLFQQNKFFHHHFLFFGAYEGYLFMIGSLYGLVLLRGIS